LIVLIQNVAIRKEKVYPMTTKGKFIKDIRPAKGDVDVNDALRLAVEDPRFARAFIAEPEKFAAAFNMREIEVAAIRDAINIGGIGGIEGGRLNEWYE
jgi:hypothetical protein